MFQVTPIPAFNDNYIWVLATPGNSSVAVVDPGDAQAVIDYLDQTGNELNAVLITHHHQDHTGGAKELQQRYNVPVYGPEDSSFDGITEPLKQDDTIQISGKSLTVHQIPGHTLDHICYYAEQIKPQLFCGDTLFLAGCGRLFEGSAKQMLSAMQLFQSMPEDTEVYCTHEYSLANLAFAAAVEPENRDIAASIESCQKLREDNKPTLPTSLAVEKKINPFMRSQHADVIKAANLFSGRELETEVEVFTAIREWKNQF